MKTILIAIDFSEHAQQLLQVARHIAKPETKVYILHIAAPNPDFVGLGVGPEYVRENRVEQLREEHHKLGEYKHQLQKDGINAEALLIAGPTIETLLDEIKKLNAELLIIGKKNHGKIYKFVIGSVCQATLEKVHIPTLVIPYAEA